MSKKMVVPELVIRKGSLTYFLPSPSVLVFFSEPLIQTDSSALELGDKGERAQLSKRASHLTYGEIENYGLRDYGLRHS